MKPLEIYVFEIVYEDCTDARPCIIAAAPVAGIVKVIRFSSQWSKFNRMTHLPIKRESYPEDFDAMGLDRDSYIDDKFVEVRVEMAMHDPNDPVGEVTGSIKKAIENWMGPFTTRE